MLKKQGNFNRGKTRLHSGPKGPFAKIVDDDHDANSCEYSNFSANMKRSAQVLKIPPRHADGVFLWCAKHV